MTSRQLPTLRPAPAAGGLRLGERLRQLRVGANMTQSQLAGDRFSKEYVSQIERGKTRPTAETIEWLAGRLGVDAGFLANGVADDQRVRVETGLAHAESLTEAGDHDAALARYEDLRTAVAATGLAELEFRMRLGEAKARVRAGQPRAALERATAARALADEAAFSDVERAEALYVMGVSRYRLASVATAIGLFNEALDLADRSPLPSDGLRAKILHWRSRCYRRQRDYEAAREDVERALELAQGLSDGRTVAHLYFQASLVAERQGHWALARRYAEQARAQYELLSDQANVGKMLNNLGGLNFLLGNADDAVRMLKGAFAAALEVGNETDAAHAVAGLAQVHLRQGELETAEQQARHALELLDDRLDQLDEIGNAHLVLGHALLAQERLDEAEESFRAAEHAFARLESPSHRASAWVAQGDLAARRGDHAGASRLYRRAADTLQDVRF